MVLFAFAIFFSAFLLFLIQPLIGKVLLPWFGGAPSVWNTCMVFFQSLLVAGYAYAHFVAARLDPKRQTRLHLGLLAFAVVTMVILGATWGVPIVPGASLRPEGMVDPIPRILLILSLSVGLPYLVLSATGPLLQAWFARLYPTSATYRLYALSNVGSLLALAAYPLLLERFLTVKAQGWFWATGFVLFAVSCALVAQRASKVTVAAEPTTTEPAKADAAGSPGVVRYVLWALLAACASVSFLATTSRLSHEIAPVPFLWLAPLGLYLLTFIIGFERDGWYRRGPILTALLIATIAVAETVLIAEYLKLRMQVAVFLAGQFLLCLACHGELARMRPSTRHLTAFYLMVSIGGALGGTFVTFVAPALFTSFAELPLSYIVGWLLIAAAVVADRRSGLYTDRKWVTWPALGLATFASVFWTAGIWRYEDTGYDYEVRNFYGVNRVVSNYEAGAPPKPDDWVKLFHGRITHGAQFRTSRTEPTAYYWRDSGVGLALRQLRRVAREENRPLRVGVVGLGVGVLAAYGEPGDTFRMYEIDHDVIRLARGEHGFFTFIKDSRATVDIIEGDARNSLESELRAGTPGRFDLLVLDAYSGDAVPIHLLTREALDVYRKHLRDERSVLAFHTSNDHLDVRAVVERLADEFNLNLLSIDADGDPKFGFSSNWELLSASREALVLPELASYTQQPRRSPPVSLWTDDHHSLLEILGPRPHRPWNPRAKKPAGEKAPPSTASSSTSESSESAAPIQNARGE